MVETDPTKPSSGGMDRIIQGSQIGLEMVLPMLLGVWIDSRWGTSPLWLLVGLVLGQAAGFWHIMKLARSSGKSPKD